MLKHPSLAFVCLLLFFATDAFAVGTFIPALARVDVAHDLKRDMVYITEGDSVLRYQIGTGTFLPPFVLGGSLQAWTSPLTGTRLQ